MTNFYLKEKNIHQQYYVTLNCWLVDSGYKMEAWTIEYLNIRQVLLCDSYIINHTKRLVMCKKLVASVDRFDKVVPLTEFLGEDNLSGKPLLVRFVNRSLDVISF